MSGVPQRSGGVGRRMIVAAVVAMMAISIFALAVPAGSVQRATSRTIDRGRVAREQHTVDVRRAGRPAGVTRRTAAARTALAKSMGTMGVIQNDPTTGSLRFVGRLDGYLTGASARSAASIALRYVRANRTAFGLRASDMRSFRLRRDAVDISGTHHLSWVQRAGGLTVFGQGLQRRGHRGRPARERDRWPRARTSRTGGQSPPQRERRDRGRQGRRPGCGHEGCS